MAEGRAYDVGYGRPPKASRFQKGRSGNPTGRRKGSRSLLADLEDELAEEVEITEGGRRVKLPKQRLLIKSAIAKGIKGDVRAMAKVFDLIRSTRAPDEGDGEGEVLSQQDEDIIADYLRRRAKEGADGE